LLSKLFLLVKLKKAGRYLISKLSSLFFSCILVKMKTQILKIDISEPDLEKVKKAAELIDSGELVAFPTETVYGIACRVRNDSLAKLNELKNRTSDKYYSLHIGDKKKIEKYVPSISIKAQKLIKSAWPGPLTIVFVLAPFDIDTQKNLLEKEVFENLYKDNSIGIRCPDNPIAAMLLKETNSPVVAPSANIAGQSPAADAEQVISNFSGRIAMLIDGGTCKYKKCSTVVKIEKQKFQILREGVYSKADIEKLSQVKFLFVCTGNSCRSPMAAALFRKYLAEKLQCNLDQLEKMGYKISSAGTVGINGMSASTEAINACKAKGADIAQHRSNALSQKAIEESDFIFVMCRMHSERVIALVPKAVKKCYLLTKKTEIADPIGQSQETYNNCADIIEKAVKERISELNL